MIVQIKLLATYRKNLPQDREGNVCQVEVKAGTTPISLLAQFDVPTDQTSVILVNGRSPDPHYLLEEGDVVCAFPAMAGG